MIRFSHIAAVLFILMLCIPVKPYAKPAGTVRGNISLYLFQAGTGSEKTGVNTIYARLGDIVTVEVFARNFSQSPVSGLEVYLTVDERYFTVVSQGKNLIKGSKYYGQSKPYIQGQYMQGAGGIVPPYGNNTAGDTLKASDNNINGWQMNYVEISGSDEGSGRPVSRLRYGVVATFQLLAKATCDSIPIKLDTDQYNLRVSRYLDPYAADSFFFNSFSTCYISVSGLEINPPLPDLKLAAGVPDSSLNLDDHVGISSIPDSLLIWTATGNKDISVTIDSRTHQVIFLAPPTFKGYEDITFTVSNADGSIRATDTMRVLVDSPPKLRASALGNTLLIHEDTLEPVLFLPQIVEDNDDAFSKLTWFFTAAGGKVNASTASDSLFLQGAPNFNGSENLRISVYDSFGVGDSLTVAVQVIPVNDPPLMRKLPDVILERNASHDLNLDAYASDVDIEPLAVSWKEPSHVALRKSGMRVTISGAPGFLGNERLYFTVTDPGGFSASDSLLVTITPAKNPPVWSKIPKVGLPQNHADSSLALWNYIADSDDADSLLTFVFANRDNVDSVYVNPRTGRTTFYDLDNAIGWDRITVTAYDPDGNSATTQFPVFIAPADGAPIVAGIPDTTMVAGAQANWIDLDDYYYDVDNTDGQMKWSWGRQAGADSSVTVYINSATHAVTLRGLSSEKFGLNRFFFTVTDPGGKFGDDICIVSSIAINRPMTDLPGKIGFAAGTKYILDLDEYVSDSAYPKSGLIWTWSGNRNCIISPEPPGAAGKISTASAALSPFDGKASKIAATRPISFTGPSSWIGWERVAFEVRNPLGGTAQDTLLVFSVTADGAPVAGGLERIALKAGQSMQVDLDPFYYDADHADFQMIWAASGGDSIIVEIDPLSHIATITAPSESWEGQNTITFTVTDPAGRSGSMQTVVAVTDAILRNAFSVSILRNPMQEDYMDLYIQSAFDLLAIPALTIRTGNDSTKVTVARQESKYFHGRYLLPLDLSLGFQGLAEIALNGKTTAGKNISGTKSFGYGRLNQSGGKIVNGPLSLEVPEGALPKPELITLVSGEAEKTVSAKPVSGEVTLSGEICTVGPVSLKADKPLVLGIRAENGRGAGIYRLTGGEPVFVGGEFRNGVVTASISGGGSFRLGYQRTPSQPPLQETHPQPLVVEQNSPNPFNPKTDISFILSGGETVTVEVFDHLGRRIAVLARGGFSAGRHSVVWDARDDQGREVSSGVYFYRVTAGGRAVSRKMLYLR